jgi:hypothetical protein
LGATVLFTDKIISTGMIVIAAFMAILVFDPAAGAICPLYLCASACRSEAKIPLWRGP